ncbi:PAS domain S-box-containing protein [Halopenitus malekzadehii]|uniref:PAS domain S-box-containing protein n=2 Tax=Halopenitus malekzadehii TaxID=1267564 RepID=A0A1H6JY87_9EURY|nr:PAS domain S-box-containing protein [Halopenitus malekzadehii]
MADSPDGNTPERDDDLFRSLVDRAAVGLFIIDPETGQILDANDRVCEWLGYAKEEVRDMTIFDCQTTFSRPPEWQTFVRRVRDEGGVEIENEIRTDTGSTLPVEGSISVASVDGTEYVVAIPRRVADRDG